MDRKTHHDFNRELSEARTRVEVGGQYYHYKHPEQFYIVRDLIIIEATEEVGVVYEAQYGGRIRFLRPLSSFLDIVEKDGQKFQRFTKVA